MENKKLRQFPLVDSKDNRYLLGSVHRIQLIRLLEQHVGPEKRQLWVTLKVKEAQEKARMAAVKEQKEGKKISRFEVVPSPDVLVVKQLTVDDLGIEEMPHDIMYDMSTEDRRKWEKQRMEMPVDFSKVRIDPAPFQLVETASLLKVHTLFSMIGIDVGYVTSQGRLVGVVGLPELRQAIQDANDGKLPPHDLEIKVPRRSERDEGESEESSDEDDEQELNKKGSKA